VKAKKKTRRSPAPLARMRARSRECKQRALDLEVAAFRLAGVDRGDAAAFRYARNDLLSAALMYAAAFRAVMGALEGLEPKGDVDHG
jgi:hypothetical protein